MYKVILIVVLRHGGSLHLTMEGSHARETVQAFTKWKQDLRTHGALLSCWDHWPVFAGDDFTVVTEEIVAMMVSQIPESESWRN